MGSRSDPTDHPRSASIAAKSGNAPLAKQGWSSDESPICPPASAASAAAAEEQKKIDDLFKK